MQVGVLQLELHLPGERSLKAKRRALRQIKDRVLHAFHLPVAEVAHQELWQRAGLGCAAAASDGQDVRALLTKVARFIEALRPGAVVRERVAILRVEE